MKFDFHQSRLETSEIIALCFDAEDRGKMLVANLKSFAIIFQAMTRNVTMRSLLQVLQTGKHHLD